MIRGVVAFCLVLMFVMAVFTGCGKEEPVDTPDGTPRPAEVEVAPEAVDTPDTSGVKDEAKESDSLEGVLKELKSKDPELADIVAKMLEDAEKKVQKTCPVEGGAIKKDIFVEYQGKKVYFCCESCKAKFKANPEKYLPKLPQFKK